MLEIKKQSFHITNTCYQLITDNFLKKGYMVCLGLEPRAAEWKAQTNPLSYGGIPY